MRLVNEYGDALGAYHVASARLHGVRERLAHYLTDAVAMAGLTPSTISTHFVVIEPSIVRVYIQDPPTLKQIELVRSIMGDVGVPRGIISFATQDAVTNTRFGYITRIG